MLSRIGSKNNPGWRRFWRQFYPARCRAAASRLPAHSPGLHPRQDMSGPFDLVIRNGIVVTAADTQRADIGVRDGRIVALGEGLPRGTRDIDAAGRHVLPGGVDGHCHLDQPMPPPAKMADDFETGSRSAACGGTTTVIPFAAQVKGHSLRAAVEDYHRRADGRACIDYAFHLIVSDPTADVLEREL